MFCWHLHERVLPHMIAPLHSGDLGLAGGCCCARPCMLLKRCVHRLRLGMRGSAWRMHAVHVAGADDMHTCMQAPMHAPHAPSPACPPACAYTRTARTDGTFYISEADKAVVRQHLLEAMIRCE